MDAAGAEDFFTPQDRYSLRPARQADLPAIRGLVQEGRINPTGLDWRRFVVAANPSAEVIGCGQLKPHGDGSLELASIVVAKSWRSQGVASALITRLLRQAPRPLYLTCQAELESFYQQFGFSALSQAEIPPYFNRIQRLFRAAAALRLVNGRLLVMRLPA